MSERDMNIDEKRRRERLWREAPRERNSDRDMLCVCVTERYCVFVCEREREREILGRTSV